MKKILSIIIAITFILLTPHFVWADEDVVTSSANTTKKPENKLTDLRIKILSDFLSEYNSPLVSYADDFMYYADEYDLDYRLVPAITGVESTFGKRIPYNSYNAYGWAGGKYYFLNWEESIMLVSKTLREKYYDKGAENIDAIAARYAPPSNSWSWKVKYFMNKIDPIPVQFDL